jgi:Zn-dependent peptidase ImmA (M78 family)
MAEVKKIENFCNELKNKHKEITDIEYIKKNCESFANDFIKFFGLEYPLDLPKLLNICHNSDIEVQTYTGKYKARGYNFCYGDKVIICYNENDSPSGKIHSVLHELFEIIIGRIMNKGTFKITKDKKEFEWLAEQFAAMVRVPGAKIISFINEHGFDVFMLRKYFNCAYITAVIRFHEGLFKAVIKNTDKPIPFISILYERAYWEQKEKTPSLELTTFKRTKGFPFTMEKSSVSQIKIYDDYREFPIDNFTKLNDNFFFPNVRMNYNNKDIPVDLFIRVRQWYGHQYPPKVLIHIIPTEYKYLHVLANKHSIKAYNLTELTEHDFF